MVKIVATTSLPVDRLTATDCNAAARAKSLPYKSTLKNYEKFEGGKLRTPKILSNLFIFLTHPSA